MNPTRCSFRYFAFLCLIALSNPSTLESLVAVVKHLAQTEPVVPNCVIYGGNYENILLEEILLDRRLEYLPRTLITSSPIYSKTNEQKPMLLIIQDYQIVEVVEVLLQFSSSIKVIVLCMNKESCDIFRYMLVYLLFHNVVYLDELNNTDVSTSSNDLFKNSL